MNKNKPSEVDRSQFKPEVLAEILEEFNGNAQVKEFKEKKIRAIRARNYLEANRITSLLKELEENTLRNLLQSAETEKIELGKLMSSMTEAEVERLNTNINAIIFLCDTIESLADDSNDLLKKYYPDYRIEMYDRIIKMGKEAHSHMLCMATSTNLFFQEEFADHADDFQTFIINKVRGTLRKIREKAEKKHLITEEV